MKAGDKGDVAPLWTSPVGSRVNSPIYHDGYLYWLNEYKGQAFCVDAATLLLLLLHAAITTSAAARADTVEPENTPVPENTRVLIEVIRFSSERSVLLDEPCWVTSKPIEEEAHAGAPLLPAAETTAARKEAEIEAEKTPSDELNVEAVFAKLKQLGGKGE